MNAEAIGVRYLTVAGFGPSPGHTLLGAEYASAVLTEREDLCGVLVDIAAARLLGAGPNDITALAETTTATGDVNLRQVWPIRKGL